MPQEYKNGVQYYDWVVITAATAQNEQFLILGYTRCALRGSDAAYSCDDTIVSRLGPGGLRIEGAIRLRNLTNHTPIIAPRRVERVRGVF